MKKRVLLNSIVLAVIVCGILCLFLLRDCKQHVQEGNVLEIQIDRVQYGTYSLEQDTSIRVETAHGYNVICIADGQAYVAEADCNDYTCIQMGKISYDGQSVICLPHGLIMTIRSDKKGAFDAITR